MMIDWVSPPAGMRPLSLTRKPGLGGRAAANLGLGVGKARGWRWLSGGNGRGAGSAALRDCGKGLMVKGRVLGRPPAG